MVMTKNGPVKDEIKNITSVLTSFIPTNDKGSFNIFLLVATNGT